MQPEKRDWTKIVQDSKDSLAFAPDSMRERIDAWKTKRDEFNKEVNRISKLEVEFKVMFENLILDLRNHFADKREDIWSADVGIEMNALKDGQHIVTISQGAAK